MQKRSFRIGVGSDFGGVLEHSVGLPSVEERERLSDLASGQGSELVAGAPDEGGVIAKVGQLIVVVGGVQLDSVVEVADVSPVAKVDLDTAVDHISEVSCRSRVSGVGRNRH